jgi:hypothetical protein
LGDRQGAAFRGLSGFLTTAAGKNNGNKNRRSNPDSPSKFGICVV